MQQCIVVQRIVYETITKPELKPAEVSGLARAWCDVDIIRRQQRMQPNPKAMDVTKLPKRGRAKAQTAEPSEPKPS